MFLSRVSFIHDEPPLDACGMRSPASCALLVVLWVTGSSSAFAQSQTTARPLETLEQEFTDPLTTLPQIFLKDAYSPTNYGTNVQTNQLVARAIIPRIPPYTLLPFAQLVRPTFSLVTVPTPRGGTRTEFGDMQLFDLAVPHWPAAESGFRFGLGPAFVFPTATSKSAGQGAWQAKVRQLQVFILAFRGCWQASFCRIQFHLLTRQLIGRLRIRLRSSRPCSFISGTAGICDQRMQRGCMAGVVIPLPSYR